MKASLALLLAPLALPLLLLALLATALDLLVSVSMLLLLLPRPHLPAHLAFGQGRSFTADVGYGGGEQLYSGRAAEVQDGGGYGIRYGAGNKEPRPGGAGNAWPGAVRAGAGAAGLGTKTTGGRGGCRKSSSSRRLWFLVWK
jgi:hypothetical protein